MRVHIDSITSYAIGNPNNQYDDQWSYGPVATVEECLSIDSNVGDFIYKLVEGDAFVQYVRGKLGWRIPDE